MSTEKRRLGPAGRVAAAFIHSKLTPLIIGASIAIGAFAVWKLPREEEPQIKVPMIDVFVAMPGASAREVEERVTKPMEKLLWEIPGVEYVYSTSSPGSSLAIVRFYVGQDEENAIVRLNQKMFANMNLVPPGATPPLIKPRNIDDVPILALTLSSQRYGAYELRQIAAQLHDSIKQTPDVSEVTIIGGERRELRVTLDPARLAAYGMTPMQAFGAIGAGNRKLSAGAFAQGNREMTLEAGDFLRSAEDARALAVGASNGRPVFLRDIATVTDGGEEPLQYVSTGTRAGFAPAVTIAVSKRKGTNAITVAEAVLERVEHLKGRVVPADVEVAITRQYGETAAEKSNELLFHMLIAVVSVSVLIAITLGFRESWVVFTAIPVTLALTLTMIYLYGFTLNRITLFALIFSIGILVDDAIVVVENIARHWRLPQNQGRDKLEIAVEAVDEVGNPTILATLAVIAAILPMAFVGGLMGPYMRPIPIGASSAMVFSLIVAFIVTPWAAVRMLKVHGGPGHEHDESEDVFTRFYRRVMNPLLHNGLVRWSFLGVVTLLLVGSCALVGIEFVKVKMLPFDNKSEFQVIIDMPTGTTLEDTERVARELARATLNQPEVTSVQTYTGTASPYNFNGLVRHYYLRRGPNVADIQVNLLGKDERKAQSHEIAKQVRARLQPIADRSAARIKVAEVPPGPPVLQTIVAEIYGPEQKGQIAIARQVKEMFKSTSGVVDVDWYVEDDQPKTTLTVDQEKAALHGITVEDIARTLSIASKGEIAGLLHQESSKEDVPVVLRLPRAERSDLERLENLKVQGRDGRLVPVSELTTRRVTIEDKSIYHKNLMPVTYVTADIAGAIESPVYAILQFGPKVEKIQTPQGYGIETLTATLPTDDTHYSMKWDGEWHIA